MHVVARFADVVGRETVPLDEAALLVAAHDRPELDVAGELERLDALAAGCAEPSLDGLRRHLFANLGFVGNTDDYYDPRNSFLDEVVTRRTGLPITLAVVTIEVGRRLGLALAGVGMPGHFLVRASAEPGTFLDPFAGGVVLDEAGCERRFRALHGDGALWLPSFLEPVDTVTILGRMLANLRAVYTSRGDQRVLAQVLSLRLALPPTPDEEARRLGLALTASVGHREAASELEMLATLLPARAGVLQAEAHAQLARLN